MADRNNVLELPLGVSGAEMDDQYRYQLWRVWDEEQDRLGWVMLNPSTADHTEDDPTIRRCLGFARSWGFGSIEVVNLYALRATQPQVVSTAIKEHGESYAIGPHNDEHLVDACGRCKTIVAAWGAQKFADARAEVVTSLLRAHHPNVLCLGLTAARQPRHPLYLANDTIPKIFA